MSKITCIQWDYSYARCPVRCLHIHTDIFCPLFAGMSDRSWLEAYLIGEAGCLLLLELLARLYYS